jgi:hypothetical protein
MTFLGGSAPHASKQIVVDKEGRHYLGAHGLDPYSLVYSRGHQGKVDHISYVVHHIDDLVARRPVHARAPASACRSGRRPPSSCQAQTLGVALSSIGGQHAREGRAWHHSARRL